MKLLRFEDRGFARLGVLRGDEIVELESIVAEYPTMMSIIHGGEAALAKIKQALESSTSGRSLTSVKLLAPIERPGKYLAIGMNYKKHQAEALRLGVATPAQQLWFNKQTTCIVGPYDDIDPGVTEQLDYEAELGAVIGRGAKHVSEQDASKFVFGYFVANDVSARDWQLHTPTFTMGKSFDTHGPIGPWIVTADEIADPQALEIRCMVNGQVRQRANTREMVNNLWKQIAYLSTAFTLEPGDLIATGTPEGVGVGMVPQSFLKPGDVVRCEIDQIGAIENRVSAVAAH